MIQKVSIDSMNVLHNYFNNNFINLIIILNNKFNNDFNNFNFKFLDILVKLFRVIFCALKKIFFSPPVATNPIDMLSLTQLFMAK